MRRRPRVDDLVLLTLGTGIGGGISSAAAFTTARSAWRAAGHITISPMGIRAAAEIGCLESTATAVSAMAACWDWVRPFCTTGP
jgi:predicted NBD/HSP70 family sugar kinase